MVITLPPLPYAKNALQPHISEETLGFHYDKHHAGYVKKLNGFIEGTEHENSTLEDIIKRSSAGAIYNNASQIWNHTFYWNSMKANGGGEPTGIVGDEIKKTFGTYEQFRKDFSDAAAGHFGSGWAWLAWENRKLCIKQTHDGDSPLTKFEPILTCDVWEHAYYIDYRNDRPSYLKAWWNLANWDFANENLAKAMKKDKE